MMNLPTVDREPRRHPSTHTLPYHLALKGVTVPKRHRWSKVPASLAAFGIVYLLATAAFTAAALFTATQLGAFTGVDPADMGAMAGALVSSFGGLLVAAAPLVALIPAAAAAHYFTHRLRPGFLLSVAGRFRWAELGVYTLIASGVLIVVTAFTAPWESQGPPLWGMVAGVVVVVPVMAFAEEVFFRGYLLHVLSRWDATGHRARIIRPAIAVMSSSALFALLHFSNGQPTPAAFAWFFTFGVFACALTIYTGGLEASTALHVANNTVTLLFLALFGVGGSPAVDAGGFGWGSYFTGVGVFAVYAAVVWAGTSRRQLATRTVPGYVRVPNHVLGVSA